MASASSYYNTEELNSILSRFDFSVINALNPLDFKDFGVMDSKKYAEKLLNLATREKLTPEAFTMVVVFATAVKNKRRITASIRPFKNKAWFKLVDGFFRDNVCQYTYEETPDMFSVVHIPSCLPFLASRIWLQITEEPTVEKFCKNLWAAQINLDEKLLEKQKNFEKEFWTDVVKRGGNQYAGNKFNENFWTTKASDKYLLLNKEGKPYGAANVINLEVPYTEKMVDEWIKTKVVFKPKTESKVG